MKEEKAIVRFKIKQSKSTMAKLNADIARGIDWDSDCNGCLRKWADRKYMWFSFTSASDAKDFADSINKRMEINCVPSFKYEILYKEGF